MLANETASGRGALRITREDVLKVFKPGLVIEWSNGARAILGAESRGLFQVFDVGSASFSYVLETTLQNSSWPTGIQPGQLYQGTIYRYTVLAPLPRYRWRCEVEGNAFTTFEIDEFTIKQWILIEGLKPTSRNHGPHTCPRCGSEGALILFKVVECVDSSCQWYKPL